jgi:hypothetical protein
MQEAGSLFYSQQGTSMPLQATLGSQPSLPAPSLSKQFAAQLNPAVVQQQQQQQLSQAAQWSALQGVLRGMSGKAHSGEGLSGLSAALASSQAQMGQLGWQGAQQNRAAPRYQVRATFVIPEHLTI